MGDTAIIQKDIADLKQFILDALVGVNNKIDRLDQKIDGAEGRLSRKIDEVDYRLSQKIDEVDCRLDQKIDDLAAAVGDAMDRTQAFMDELWGNHERRLCRLEKHTA